MSQTPPSDLVSRLIALWPPSAWRDTHIVLAVSAGPDSVAMLRAVLTVRASCGGAGRLVAAHLNHGLRSVDSDADQAWLESLCQRLEVPLEVGRADAAAIAAAQGDGIEAAARDARYEFLTHTAEKLGGRFVAVAHTADDQVETILHRILRGAGLLGLAGMPATRRLSPTVSLVRPLLGVRRCEVLEYLQAIGQDYRIDPTNANTRWTRNRLRHELLPALRQQYNAGVDEALLRLAAQAAESHEVISALAQRLADRCVRVEFSSHVGPVAGGARAEIDCGQASGTPPPVIREMCRLLWQEAHWPMQAMGFEAWQSLANLVQGTGPSSLDLPGKIRAYRRQDRIVIEKLA